ncbi:hypothetical protein D9C73_027038 [Collichthys lucidus]|uniref:Uncharacterized protein n=1 Tax=Collichthys lucidus TaxID=240159 RepID=A0A4U5VZC6_COLLU|nr:hypothetical protein D9C73_027038 [Collichthys lucidus]
MRKLPGGESVSESSRGVWRCRRLYFELSRWQRYWTARDKTKHFNDELLAPLKEGSAQTTSDPNLWVTRLADGNSSCYKMSKRNKTEMPTTKINQSILRTRLDFTQLARISGVGRPLWKNVEHKHFISFFNPSPQWMSRRRRDAEGKGRTKTDLCNLTEGLQAVNLIEPVFYKRDSLRCICAVMGPLRLLRESVCVCALASSEIIRPFGNLSIVIMSLTRMLGRPAERVKDLNNVMTVTFMFFLYK